MDEMKELVTVEQAERVIAALAVALPVAGAAAGAVIGAVKGRLGAGALAGLLCGLLGPAVWLMWRLHNLVMDRYGLDSVRGLLIDLILFAGIGALVGLVVAVAARRLARTARPDAEVRHPPS